jgi:hypothetical protein
MAQVEPAHALLRRFAGMIFERQPGVTGTCSPSKATTTPLSHNEHCFPQRSDRQGKKVSPVVRRAAEPTVTVHCLGHPNKPAQSERWIESEGLSEPELEFVGLCDACLVFLSDYAEHTRKSDGTAFKLMPLAFRPH